MSAPGEPASGYLVQGPEGALVMDLGPGSFGELQRHIDPCSVDVALSHLHADHCLDLPGMIVWRRFHPKDGGGAKANLFGPSDTAERIGRASAETGDSIDDISDTFNVHTLTARQSFQAGGMTVTPFPMVHPIVTFGFRVESADYCMAYTGDTAWTDELVEMAQGADLLLAEATWCGSAEGPVAGMHISGFEAGRAAREAGVRELVLTHIPPYNDKEAALAAARSEFDGPVSLAYCGRVIEVGN
ncbi:MBL fold metallo-hydrolase [Corynebacterium sp. TAE3-ERU12]|uniref:MBL fold metallo-hydrolase n=1 Tax=Corynebacterium sp. TAE3-ERU12 TaxID=2849491 RepID=UPI00351D9ACA